jgi:hypothetical protein
MHRLGVLVFVIGCGSGCTDTEPARVAGLPVVYAWGNCQGPSEQEPCGWFASADAVVVARVVSTRMTAEPCVDPTAPASWRDSPPEDLASGHMAFEVSLEIIESITGTPPRRLTVSFGRPFAGAWLPSPDASIPQPYDGPQTPSWVGDGPVILPGMLIGMSLIEMKDRDGIWKAIPPFFTVDGDAIQFGEIDGGCGFTGPAGLHRSTLTRLRETQASCSPDAPPSDFATFIRSGDFGLDVRGQIDAAECASCPAGGCAR